MGHFVTSSALRPGPAGGPVSQLQSCLARSGIEEAPSCHARPHGGSISRSVHSVRRSVRRSCRRAPPLGQWWRIMNTGLQPLAVNVRPHVRISASINILVNIIYCVCFLVSVRSLMTGCCESSLSKFLRFFVNDFCYHRALHVKRNKRTKTKQKPNRETSEKHTNRSNQNTKFLRICWAVRLPSASASRMSI